jgi:hypothetical protein
MSKPMNKGRLPASQKPMQSKIITSDEAFGGSSFEIPEHIKADMKEKGLTPRWLSATEVYKNQGYHKKGWKIYYDKNALQIPEAFKFGTDPDGVVRRGDCILGYKDKDASAKHSAFLRQQAGETKDLRNQQANELRQMAESMGIKTHVDSSDDDV